MLAGTGYVVCLLQWLWIVILTLPILLDSGWLSSFVIPENQLPPAEEIKSETVSPLLVAIGGGITILMLALSALIIFKLPSKVVQTGTVITHAAADAIVPLVTHHKRLPAKKTRILTIRVLLYIKLALVLVPLIVCFFVPIDTTFNRDLVVFIGSSLATIALSLFGLEHAFLYIQSRRTK